MQFVDLKTQYTNISGKINRRIQAVLDHGRYIMGPEVAELEGKLAEYAGVKHAVGVSSGTDALVIAMMALGIGQGDEVITTPFTFIATAETIALLGAKPVFVDIDPETYNINPGLIEAAVTEKTRAIMPVSLYGQCADFDAINAIAEKRGISVIEDGAQSFGATYKGRRSCSLSTIGATSFFPSKPLGCYGDGGACLTNDDALAEQMRRIRAHGQQRRYRHTVLGLNGRLDTIQAAVAEKRGISVIEDGAQSFGATYKGRRSCSLSTIGATSFFPSKPLGCYGDGGACLTNDDALAEQMRRIRAHGQQRRYRHTVLGLNGRLDTIQAAIVLEKLALFPEEVTARGRIGARYTKLLRDYVATPSVANGCGHVYAQYTIKVDNRQGVQEKLKERSIPTAVHYPAPLHLQPVFEYLGLGEGSYPQAESASNKVMSLPMSPYLAEKDQDAVIEAVKSAVENPVVSS